MMKSLKKFMKNKYYINKYLIFTLGNRRRNLIEIIKFKLKFMYFNYIKARISENKT